MVIKKRNVIIASILAAVTVGCAIGIPVGIWAAKKKPRTTQEWLDDFASALTEDANAAWQGRQRSIRLTENQILVARFEEAYTIDLRNAEKPLGHFSAKETYLTVQTEEENIADEYFYADGMLHMRRVAGTETIQTAYEAPFETFMTILRENAEQSAYALQEAYLTDIIITKEETCVLQAGIAEESKQLFFLQEDTTDLYDVRIRLETDSSFRLIAYSLQYQTAGLSDKQAITIEVTVKSIGQKQIDRPAWTV